MLRLHPVCVMSSIFKFIPNFSPNRRRPFWKATEVPAATDFDTYLYMISVTYFATGVDNMSPVDAIYTMMIEMTMSIQQKRRPRNEKKTFLFWFSKSES